MAIDTRLLLVASFVLHISFPDNPKTINLKICADKRRTAKCDEASKTTEMYVHVRTNQSKDTEHAYSICTYLASFHLCIKPCICVLITELQTMQFVQART
jgi:hypothetical protein